MGGSIFFTSFISSSDLPCHFGFIDFTVVEAPYCFVNCSKISGPLRLRGEMCLSYEDFVLELVFSVGLRVRAGSHAFYLFCQNITHIHRLCMSMPVRSNDELMGRSMTRELSMTQTL